MDEIEAMTFDYMVARGDVLIRLVQALEATKDPAMRMLLAGYAIKVDRSVKVAEPTPANTEDSRVISFPPKGPKHDA